MSKQPRNIIFGSPLQKRLQSGVEQAYYVAKAAYGPDAGNAILELEYGDPLVSRDGVTNVEKIYLEDPNENMAARLVVQASKKNNRKVGDGTTAVVILAHHLYKEANKLLNAGHNRMEVSRALEALAREVVEQIDALKIPVTDELLQQVAIISAGDAAIGQMIADVIKEIGIDGGAVVEDFAGTGIYNELVEGFYFRKGFTNANLINDSSNLESKHEEVDIFITDKKMAVQTDIAPIIEKIVSAGGRELILVGDASEEVLGFLILNRLKGVINVTVVDIPTFGAMRTLTLEDLALIVGAKVYTSGANASDFDISMLGTAKRVFINEYSTTIVGGDGESEAVQERIKELHDQMMQAESPTAVEALRERLARLTGKVALVRVGGATEVEQKEVKLRVQDAICAVQAAIKDGIVPGGGVTLAKVKSTSPLADALKAPFKCLIENTGENVDRALWKIEQCKDWFGYDLRTYTEKPVNLLDAGVIDPALVVKEVIRNSTSVISKLITADVGITYINREQKHD